MHNADIRVCDKVLDSGNSVTLTFKMVTKLLHTTPEELPQESIYGKSEDKTAGRIRWNAVMAGGGDVSSLITWANIAPTGKSMSAMRP